MHNYFNLCKMAKNESTNMDSDEGFDDFDDMQEREKPSELYYTSLGMRIKVVPQSNKLDEKQMVRNIVSKIRGELANCNVEFNTDDYEAWFDGLDDDPKQKHELF